MNHNLCLAAIDKHQRQAGATARTATNTSGNAVLPPPKPDKPAEVGALRHRFHRAMGKRRAIRRHRFYPVVEDTGTDRTVREAVRLRTGTSRRRTRNQRTVHHLTQRIGRPLR